MTIPGKVWWLNVGYYHMASIQSSTYSLSAGTTRGVGCFSTSFATVHMHNFLHMLQPSTVWTAFKKDSIDSKPCLCLRSLLSSSRHGQHTGLSLFSTQEGIRAVSKSHNHVLLFPHYYRWLQFFHASLISNVRCRPTFEHGQNRRWFCLSIAVHTCCHCRRVVTVCVQWEHPVSSGKAQWKSAPLPAVNRHQYARACTSGLTQTTSFHESKLCTPILLPSSLIDRTLWWATRMADGQSAFICSNCSTAKLKLNTWCGLKCWY